MHWPTMNACLRTLFFKLKNLMWPVASEDATTLVKIVFEYVCPVCLLKRALFDLCNICGMKGTLQFMRQTKSNIKKGQYQLEIIPSTELIALTQTP